MNPEHEKIAQEAAGNHYDSFSEPPKWSRIGWIKKLSPFILSAITKATTTEQLVLLETVVAELADPMKWNWMQGIRSERHAADKVLSKLAEVGLIEHAEHPLGGDIWMVNGKRYGRLD